MDCTVSKQSHKTKTKLKSYKYDFYGSTNMIFLWLFPHAYKNILFSQSLYFSHKFVRVPYSVSNIWKGRGREESLPSAVQAGLYDPSPVGSSVRNSKEKTSAHSRERGSELQLEPSYCRKWATESRTNTTQTPLMYLSILVLNKPVPQFKLRISDRHCTELAVN